MCAYRLHIYTIPITLLRYARMLFSIGFVERANDSSVFLFFIVFGTVRQWRLHSLKYFGARVERKLPLTGTRD